MMILVHTHPLLPPLLLLPNVCCGVRWSSTIRAAMRCCVRRFLSGFAEGVEKGAENIRVHPHEAQWVCDFPTVHANRILEKWKDFAWTRLDYNWKLDGSTWNFQDNEDLLDICLESSGLQSESHGFGQDP